MDRHEARHSAKYGRSSFFSEWHPARMALAARASATNCQLLNVAKVETQQNHPWSSSQSKTRGNAAWHRQPARISRNPFSHDFGRR